ncbi:hypothetical protein ALO86_200230 [Pseudomonas syringae pv. berberidis]|nr:hypothetical protein ALO86_200230 [Pseudomonas syringae pv. berberidis]
MCCVELDKYLPAFGFAQELDRSDYLALVLDHCTQHPFQIRHVALRRISVEQRRRIFQRTDDPALYLRQVERHIVLGGAYYRIQQRQLQPVDREFRRRHVLPRQHRLEQRAMGQAAHRLEQLHHLLERQILVFIRRQRAGLDPTQQCLDRRVV